jgi:hypothetical protein
VLCPKYTKVRGAVDVYEGECKRRGKCTTLKRALTTKGMYSISGMGTIQI